MTLELLPAAKELLAKESYDRAFGARPLRRAIQRLIQDPLAERLLMKDFKEGDTIYVDAQYVGCNQRGRSPDPTRS